MSTKMSTDLNIVRSSTRRHAPPGGKSSICIGDSSAYESANITGRRHQPYDQTHHDGADNDGDSYTRDIKETSRKHVTGGESTLTLSDSGAVEHQYGGRKHIKGHGVSSVELSDDAPVEPAPPGKKHVPATNTTSSIFRKDNELAYSLRTSAPLHTSKKHAGGGESTICLGESEPIIERPNSERKHVHGTNSFTTISLGECDSPAELANSHTVRKHSDGNKSTISLSNDAPLEKIYAARKQVAGCGASSVSFGECEPERPATGRRYPTRASDSMNDVFNHDCPHTRAENKPVVHCAPTASNSSQMMASLSISDEPVQQSLMSGRRNTAGGASSIVLG
mmetsp:Transcript_1830/g.2899  ORF Transcript_1830/g.2899 Transcript_1830/m.2899 type:complete len:337 (+) Transcript_1830:78-1088(+)